MIVPMAPARAPVSARGWRRPKPRESIEAALV
jgi:hypothetical protein